MKALLIMLVLVLCTGTVFQFQLEDRTNVDAELVLAVDASGSIEPPERELQRQGYAAAIQSPEVLNAIQYGGKHRKIAITYFEWGTYDRIPRGIPWTVIEDEESAAAFADRILALPNVDLGNTSIQKAMEVGYELLNTNEYIAHRRLIDISGDGPNNNGNKSLEDTKAGLLEADPGLTINGLVILHGKSDADAKQLAEYYEECVTGGHRSFLETAAGLDDFPRAVRAKLRSELGDYPGSPVITASSHPGSYPGDTRPPRTKEAKGLGFIYKCKFKPTSTEDDELRIERGKNPSYQNSYPNSHYGMP